MNAAGDAATEAPRIDEFGDGALLVTLGDRIDVDLNVRAHRLARAIDLLRVRDPRFGRPVPGYASVLAPFGPLELDAAEARAIIEPLVTEAAAPAANRERDERRPVITIPVRYGGEDGPDLEAVAELHELRPSDVVELHSHPVYHVFMIGFAPGFAYLGPIPRKIATPRLATPRPRVPAGSVAIAGAQTAVYPFATPGGWHLIGRTDAPIWDISRPAPAFLSPGDRVRFEPVDGSS